MNIIKRIFGKGGEVKTERISEHEFYRTFDSDPGSHAPREATAPPVTAVNAPGRQIGGTHYNAGDKPQHWDYVIHCLHGRYLEGNASKYVMRHKKKGTAVQDLDKALHYLEKLRVEHGRGNIAPITADDHDTAHGLPLVPFCAFHNQDTLQSSFLAGLMHWNNETDLLDLVKLVNMMRDEATQDAVMLNARKAGAVPYTPERRGTQPREQNLHSLYPPDRSFGQRIPDVTPASDATTLSPDARPDRIGDQPREP